MIGIAELPARVRVVYEETRRSYLQKMPVLAGMGIRTLVEAICNDCKAGGNGLEEKISWLASRGVRFVRRPMCFTASE